jgi:hypothetical protein
MSSALLAVQTPQAASAARARVAARSKGRGTSRRKPRPPQPVVPQDFFSPDAHALLTDLLITRAAHWQGAGAPPIFYYSRDSEPIWGDFAQHHCSGTTIRIACQRVLYDCLCMDLERGLRLLTLTWTADGTTMDGHTCEEWRGALAGVLWRVGQLFREVTRRKGAAGAQEVLRLATETLHW